MTNHNDVIRQSFTTQAPAFAATPWVNDERRIRRLVMAAQLAGKERVLDVATGPGFIAEAFAGTAREVIGVDLTDAMLQIARERTSRRGIANVSFQCADGNQLPFDQAQFDAAVCRLALHHVTSPGRMLREMARVTRPNGLVLIEDIYASEHPERAAFQDRWETLRDASHVRTLPLSELLLLFRAAQLEVTSVATYEDLTPEVERWLTTTQTPPERADEVRRLLEEDMHHDRSGARPFRDGTGKLCFHARTAIVAGRRFSS